jgi:uncharacterized membrane protein YdjX (TVP38/TMEM64 family)
MNEHWRRAAFLFALVAALVIAAADDDVHGAIMRLIEFVSAVVRAHPVAGLALFVVLSAVSAMVMFFSTALIVPVAVEAWGAVNTVLLLWIGWMLGGILTYTVGRYPGRRLLRWLLPEKQVARFEGLFTDRASLGLIILFQLALPSEVPGYVLGSAGCRFSRYVVALAIVELPFALGSVYLSDSFMRRDLPLLFVFAACGAALSVAAMCGFHRATSGKDGLFTVRL